MKKFEEITEGITMTKAKIKRRNDEEKTKRDQLNSELLGFIETQRKYAAMVKQFRIACERRQISMNILILSTKYPENK